MVGVPAVWELIRKGILSKVDTSGAVKKGVFNAAISAKQAAQKYYIPFLGGLTDTVVFNQVSYRVLEHVIIGRITNDEQVRQQTGGRLKIMFNGGGAVSKSTQEFLTTALVTMIQGAFHDSLTMQGALAD